jgi:hypothetical protein
LSRFADQLNLAAFPVWAFYKGPTGKVKTAFEIGDANFFTKRCVPEIPRFASSQKYYPSCFSQQLPDPASYERVANQGSSKNISVYILNVESPARKQWNNFE